MRKKIYNTFIKLFMFFLLIGVGVLLGKIIINIIDNKLTVIEAFLNIICFIVFFFLFYNFNILLHEIGHLLCGLISGYKFSSLTIGNIIILNRNNKLLIKKFHIHGTGGQCLMKPPSYDNGNFVYKLYLLGGILANLAGLVIACVVIMMKEENSLIIYSFIVSTIGIMLTNIRINDFGVVDTDLGTLINMRNDVVSKRAFWLQLYVACMQNDDMEIHTLPKDMLTLPENIELSNNLNFYWYYMVCMYEFKNKNYIKFRKMVDDIKDKKDLKQSVYMNELLCELLFLDIMQFQYIYNKEYWDKQNLKVYLEKTKGFLSRQRLLYAYHLLINDDSEKANYHLKKFFSTADTWPYLRDIQDEKYLIDLVKKSYVNK